MKKNVAVSVIVPLYNRKKTIARCLDSLIGQTLEELEIVVVDDGSSDGGAEVVREYQKKDSRIVLVVQENQGPGAARNAGIRICKGEYVGFVDCDDYVDRHMYESLLKAVKDFHTEVAVCQERNVCFDSDGMPQTLSETAFPNKSIRIYSREQTLKWFLNSTYLSLNSVCFKLVKKTFFSEKNIWFPENYRHVEDLPVSGGIFSYAEKVAFVPASMYYYIHESGTRSTSCSVKKAVDIYSDMVDVVRYLRKSGSKAEIDNFILGMKFSSLRQFYGSEKKERRKEEGDILKKKWKRLRRKARPKFYKAGIPFVHKIKILVAYFYMEPLMCAIFRLFKNIPFIKYMV